jgi:hypothetical protein
VANKSKASRLSHGTNSFLYFVTLYFLSLRLPPFFEKKLRDEASYFKELPNYQQLHRLQYCFFPTIRILQRVWYEAVCLL